jgi:FixJ family two-component response regulator
MSKSMYFMVWAVSESECMAPAGDHILLIENDPHISDIIARQTLRSVGYQVDVITDAASAIKASVQTPHDLIIVDLNLPGLSAKDMIIALSSQGVHTPILALANKGQEHDIIQAFRLGAADYIFWPARDAEVLSAVERVLSRVHEVRDRQRLDSQLIAIHQQFQRMLRELNTLINIGKAVSSITNQRALFQRIVDGAIQLSGADLAWLLVRDEKSREFFLFAQRGLPQEWAGRMNKPLDDGVSRLVAQSGETLSISGEPLSKLKVAFLGRSVCAVPVKVQREVIGMLMAMRREARPFGKEEQVLLEAVADYVSISLVNARLFGALNSTVRLSREAEERQAAFLKSFHGQLVKDLKAAVQPVDIMLAEKTDKLSESQRETLKTTRAALERLARTVENGTASIPLQLKRQ